MSKAWLSFLALPLTPSLLHKVCPLFFPSFLSWWLVMLGGCRGELDSKDALICMHCNHRPVQASQGVTNIGPNCLLYNVLRMYHTGRDVYAG